MAHPVRSLNNYAIIKIYNIIHSSLVKYYDFLFDGTDKVLVHSRVRADLDPITKIFQSNKDRFMQDLNKKQYKISYNVSFVTQVGLYHITNASQVVNVNSMHYM